MKVGKLALSGEKKLLSCAFSSRVPCSFRKSEKSGIMRRCSGCGHYRNFVNEMEREEEEFWNVVDKANKDLRCCCDGNSCGNEPVGACFGARADSGEVFRCSRFDVNRLADGSVIKEEYLRLGGGDSAEY